MIHEEGTGEYYCIAHLVQFTGLSDRTIRNYLSMGILQGEKINGLWHFTPEQTEAFLRHPAVRPSILSRRNAMIYDFLADTKKEEHRVCMILDLPGDDKQKIVEHFCYAISNEDYSDIQFSFDSIEGEPRVMVKGRPEQVLRLVQAYYGR